jgi:rsbT co-antagonist protein RsbR
MNELAEIITKNENKIRAEWIESMSKSVSRADLMSKAELDEQCGALLNAIVAGVKTSGPTEIAGAGWNQARDLLQAISVSRARQGFSPVDVATFVLSL